MKIKNINEKLSHALIKIKSCKFIQSTTLCSVVVQQLINKICQDLPPDPQILLNYSSILVSQTTAKLVDVNMLGSDQVQSEQQVDQNDQIEDIVQIYEKQSSQNQKKWKKLQTQNSQFNLNENYEDKNKKSKSYLIKSLLKNKNIRIKEDDQIQLKKDGIRFVKKEELRNLIKHRISNSFNSLHLNNSTIQSISTKKSLNEKDDLKKNNAIFQTNSHKIDQKSKILIKSVKSLSTFPGIKTPNLEVGEFTKQRISGVLNQTQFVNLRDYYKEKQIKEPKFNPIKRISNLNYNSYGHSNSPSNFSSYIHQRLNNDKSCSWLEEKEIERPDEDDVIINKLRQRKEKFYRTGLNYSNGDSLANTKRENQMPVNPNQKSNPRDNQTGALLAFDYSGEIMPTFKYDTIKIQSHYQEMEFSVNQNDQSMSKKRERKGHMYRGAINLKLVDHQRFIPHPNYKYQPLAQKSGMLMKQNAGYMLKKGVQLRGRDDNTNTSANSNAQTQQTRERINKASFQFLYNDELIPNKIKYQQFARYKKNAQSSNSFHKNISSRKKLFDLTNLTNNQSLLSKKSIALKGIKNKQNQAEDETNKVYKSQNRKALEMLINTNQNGGNDLTGIQDKQIQSSQHHQTNSGVTGVLKHYHSKSLSNNVDKNIQAKKKVRIA